jgi:hypothetical protein
MKVRSGKFELLPQLLGIDWQTVRDILQFLVQILIRIISRYKDSAVGHREPWGSRNEISLLSVSLQQLNERK